MLVPIEQEEQHCADSYMRRRESGRGPFAGCLCEFHQVAEEAVRAGRVRHLGVVSKVVADGGEVSRFHHVEANGFKVILRPGCRYEEENEVVEKESCKNHKGRSFKNRTICPQRRQNSEENEWVVGEVAEMEQFTPKFAVQELCKDNRGLAIKKSLIGCGKYMVEVREELAKFVGVGVPVAQEGDGKEIPKQKRGEMRMFSVNEKEEAHSANNERAAFKQAYRVGHLLPKEEDEASGEQRVCQREELNRERVRTERARRSHEFDF